MKNFNDAFKVAVAVVVIGYFAVLFDNSLSSLFPLALIPINRENEEKNRRLAR